MGQIIGKSEYSIINSYEDPRETTQLVEKKSFGIGTYFTQSEKSINERIRTIADAEGGNQFIMRYFGESEERGLLFERAEYNLKDAPTLNPKDFAHMIGHIVQGIQFLDKYRISHRDLHRIENIFVFPNSLYKIGDFGLSAIIEPGSETGNLHAFAAAIYSYIGEKILGLTDVVDSMTDVHDLLSRSPTINSSIKVIILEFLEIAPNELKAEHFNKLAIELLNQGLSAWND